MKLRGKGIGSQKCARGKVSGPSKRTILVAGMGTSPAVLTDVVWRDMLGVSLGAVVKMKERV